MLYLSHFKLFCIVAILLQASNCLEAKVLTVCKNCKFQTLEAALTQATPHDTIRVKQGIYKEHGIVIDKPIRLLGENFPILDGGYQGEIIRIVSDSVTIDGFYIKHVGISHTEDYAAIRVQKSHYFRIQNNRFEQFFFGIYLEKSGFGKIVNNSLHGSAKQEYNSGNGVHLWYSHHIEVKRNKISGVRDGIYLEFSDDCVISDNFSYNNLRYGLHFMFSNSDKYQNNLFENNGAGVAVMFSKKIIMRRNTFRKNWGNASYGLLLKEINDATIEENIFQKNTTGIHVEGSNRITYKHNAFINNGWALMVRGACYFNKFYENNFMNNAFNVAFSSMANDNYFRRNYWSTYSGYDLNNDGIGDVPYRPIKLFSYIVNRSPESIVLLRSLFIAVLDFSEKVYPSFTPDEVIDPEPMLKPNVW